MTLILYLDLMSQPCRALYITLSLHNIPFEAVYINLVKGEHLTGEFTKNVSRFNKVPVINDNGFNLTESISILRYLANTRQLPDNWYPQNPKEQARIDEYLEWQHSNTRFFCSMFFRKKCPVGLGRERANIPHQIPSYFCAFSKGNDINTLLTGNFAQKLCHVTGYYFLIEYYILPRLFGKETSPESLQRCVENMEKCLDEIESRWLTPGPYINSVHLTAADIWAACEIEQPRMCGYEVGKGRPKLAAWLERVRNETNPWYDEAHEKVNKIAKNEMKLKPKL